MLQFYDRVMAPLECLGLSRIRKELLSSVEGAVLEVGFGTGENLRYYPTRLAWSNQYTENPWENYIIDPPGPGDRPLGSKESLTGPS
jgi:hypothetical protein